MMELDPDAQSAPRTSETTPWAPREDWRSKSYTPSRRIPADVQKVLDTAIDDRPYRTWTDKDGRQHSTAGALLPPGYHQSDDPAYPWLCAVRSCRRMFESLHGLGRHYCVSPNTVTNDRQAGRF
ncbi:uncharacterized protein THITE_2109463 [Thermothielavioides terrestris NRRL 8126]|uniref:Uncharacterized protein n=1 Tax=Thermothielavioides terrestris (strain ATCC 38088 / NRRL 8126) TaxID=578455 RepID=G2QVT6_THETT|nr:uncharacterized protein THITE_2109463 [Thermothielavioides terrestris NRRL 8126]AEO63867.1 hypothetical protein THITE_2109463 [Thermothielavioides terrestris NRRL 8126]